MPTINVRWSDNTQDLAKNLARGTTQLEATRASVDKLVKSFQGDNLIAAAHKWAVAIDQIGGITKLTAAEQTRANAIFTKASEKLTLLGKDGTYAGEQFKLLAAQTKGAAQATDAASQSTLAWGSVLRGVTGILGAFGVSLSVGAVVNFGRSLLKTAGDIKDLSLATGVSKKALQEFAYVGAGVNVSMDEIGRAVGSLSKRLAGGDESAVAAVIDLGLNVNKLIAGGPKEAFIEIGDAVGQMTDPMKKSTIAADLFGDRLAQHLIPMLGNLRTEMEAVPKDALISDAQIEAADKFGDAWDRAAIRFKASIFGMIEAFNKFNAVPPIDIEASVARLTAAGVTAGPLFDALAKHRAREAAETQAAMRAAYAYADSLGVVAGYAQGSAEVEKIHAAMLAASEAAAKKAADALTAYNAIVKEVTATQDTFAETVDTIDGAIVEGIRYYLERGKSIEQLATMYDLLTTQVQAVSGQMKLEAAATKEATAAAEAAFKAFVSEVTALNDLAAALRRVEHGNDRMNVDLTKIGEHVDVLPPKVKEATSAFSDLAKAFAQLSQIGGGSFDGIVQGIGTMIGAINVAVTAVRGLNQAIKDGTANAGTYVAAYSAAFAGIGIGLQLLSDWTTAGMKRQDELGRKINAIIDAFYAPFQDAISRVEGGLHLLDEAAAMAGISLDRFHAALNMPTSPAKYLEIVSAINEINLALEIDNQLRAKENELIEARLSLGQRQIANANIIIASIGDQVDAWKEYQKQIVEVRKKIDEARVAGKDFAQDQKLLTELLQKQKATITITADELKNLGIIAVASFHAALAAGMSFVDAIAAAAPGLQQLKAAFDALGIRTDNVLFKTLMFQAAILDNNPSLVRAIGALGDSFGALAALGMLNEETFRAMEETGAAMYTKLQSEAARVGGGTRDALLPMQDYLHRAERAAAELGIPLDANTQMLIDQSKELLIWKEAGKTATDKMIDAMTILVKSIDDLTKALESIPNISRTVDIYQRTHNQAGEEPPVPGTGNAATGGIVHAWGIQRFGTGGLVQSSLWQAFMSPVGTDTIPVMTSPGELILNRSQQRGIAGQLLAGDRLAAAMPARFGNASGASRVDVHAHLSLDGHEVTSVVVTDVLQDKRGAGTKLRRGLRLTED